MLSQILLTSCLVMMTSSLTIGESEKNDSSQVWPTGDYSLLQAGTECPYSSTFDWQFASVRIPTKPGANNNDATSNPSLLSPKTLEHNTTTDRHYVNLVMCAKTVKGEGPAWPKGFYCVGTYTRGCPIAFNTRNPIRIGRYDDGLYYKAIVNQPGIHIRDEFSLQYLCCKNDGDANIPIELPSRTPFYLYRYGETCQKVKGMDEQKEWIKLDSKPTYAVIIDDPHFKIGPFRLDLCYYKPRV